MGDIEKEFRIAYRITAVRSRQYNVEQIIRSCRSAVPIYDDNRLGCLKNTLSSLLSGIMSDATHICILQDDVEIVEGFEQVVETCVNRVPDAVINLYNEIYVDGDPTFIIMPTCTIKGPAIVLPRNIGIGFLRFATCSDIPNKYDYDDALLRIFCFLNDIKTVCVNPSAVRCRDDMKSTFGNSHSKKNARNWIGRFGDISCYERGGIGIGIVIPLNTHLPKENQLRKEVDDKYAKAKKENIVRRGTPG